MKTSGDREQSSGKHENEHRDQVHPLQGFSQAETQQRESKKRKLNNITQIDEVSQSREQSEIDFKLTQET